MRERYRGPDWVALGFSGLALVLILGAMVKAKLEQEKPPTTPIAGEARPVPTPKPPSAPEATVVFPTVTPTPRPTREPTPTPTPSPTPPPTQKG